MRVGGLTKKGRPVWDKRLAGTEENKGERRERKSEWVLVDRDRDGRVTELRVSIES
jgi:hypothetical protein